MESLVREKKSQPCLKYSYFCSHVLYIYSTMSPPWKLIQTIKTAVLIVWSWMIPIYHHSRRFMVKPPIILTIACRKPVCLRVFQMHFSIKLGSNLYTKYMQLVEKYKQNFEYKRKWNLIQWGTCLKRMIKDRGLCRSLHLEARCGKNLTISIL